MHCAKRVGTISFVKQAHVRCYTVNPPMPATDLAPSSSYPSPTSVPYPSFDGVYSPFGKGVCQNINCRSTTVGKPICLVNPTPGTAEIKSLKCVCAQSVYIKPYLEGILPTVREVNHPKFTSEIEDLLKKYEEVPTLFQRLNYSRLSTFFTECLRIARNWELTHTTLLSYKSKIENMEKPLKICGKYAKSVTWYAERNWVQLGQLLANMEKMVEASKSLANQKLAGQQAAINESNKDGEVTLESHGGNSTPTNVDHISSETPTSSTEMDDSSNINRNNEKQEISSGYHSQ